MATFEVSWSGCLFNQEKQKEFTEKFSRTCNNTTVVVRKNYDCFPIQRGLKYPFTGRIEVIAVN